MYLILHRCRAKPAGRQGGHPPDELCSCFLLPLHAPIFSALFMLLGQQNFLRWSWCACVSLHIFLTYVLKQLWKGFLCNTAPMISWWKAVLTNPHSLFAVLSCSWTSLPSDWVDEPLPSHAVLFVVSCLFPTILFKTLIALSLACYAWRQQFRISLPSKHNLCFAQTPPQKL